jgi:SIT4-associating protein SAP185/190
MVAFIRSLPNVVDRMFAHLESPSVQDMVVRLVSAEEAGVTGVIDWLAGERLMGRLIELLSPHYPPSTHLIASDLLKSIITLCAPTPFNPAGGNAMEQAGQSQPGSRDNRLVRELASEQTISILVGYMLDDVDLTDKDWKGLNESGPSAADIFVTHPLPSLASATSSITQICSILVELIRRNNSDFSEPHLFHTMRNRLMTIRMQRGAPQPHEEEAERSDMETAMKDMSEKMGIVHLGSLLTVICRRFPDLQRILHSPRSQVSLLC